MLEFLRSLKTHYLLYKKRRALGVFDKVKGQLQQFIGEASAEIDTRESLIADKQEQIDRFVSKKEDEIDSQQQTISTVNAEMQKASQVIDNLEQLGV